MGRCRSVPYDFPNILIRLLSSPRRAGGRTNKMNSNYSNNNYKSNERALADLLGQLVRGRNNSPPGFSRGGLGGSSGGSGPLNNFGGSSMGPNGGGGGGGGGGMWGGNAPNDWNQGGGGGGGSYGSSGRGGGSGGFGNSGNGGGSGGYGNSGNGGGSIGNMMPLMQRGGGGGGGGFSGMSQGSGMNDGYGGMPQGCGMNNNFGGMQQGSNYMGMSGGNQGGYNGMPPNRGMNNSSFGGGGSGGGVFPQNDNFGGGGGFDDCPPPPSSRSRGTWVSGATNRSNRNVVAPPVRNNSRSSSSTLDRRNLSGSKTSLSSKGSRSGGASTSGNASKPVQAQKRKAPPSSAPPAKSSLSTNKPKPTLPQGNKTSAAEPRQVLTSTGGRWYQHFISKGLKPEEARKKAFENNTKPFTVGVERAAVTKSFKKSYPPPAETCIRLAIFAKGFPEVILETDDLSALEERIVDEVANSSAESKLQFERLLRKPGLFIVDCANQKTADWLIDIIPKLTNWEGAELAICYEEDIPDAYIMTLSLPRSAGQDYDQTLSLIQSQNSDLTTDSWEWVQEREDGDRSILTIRVDKESHAAIKEKKWKIFYKFGLVEVNFARYIRFALSKRLNAEAHAEKTEIKVEDQSVGKGDKKPTAKRTEENPPSPPPAPIISK